METRQQFECDTPERHAQEAIAEIPLGEDWAQQPISNGGEYYGWGLAVHDFNGDGRWDIFLPHFGRKDQLFLALEDGSVSDASYMLPDSDMLSYGATAADLDSDGDIDILVGAERGNYFYRNDNNQGFTLIEEQDFLLGQATGGRTHYFAIADVDKDGFFDLFGPTFYSRYEGGLDEESNLDNLLFWGCKDLCWERDVSWPETLQHSPANAGGWVDVDNDGYLDLYIVNDKPSLGYQSSVLRNEGGRSLKHFSNRGLDIAIQGMGLAWGDLNLDGHIDFGITGWDEHGLLLNDGTSHWYDASLSWGLVTDDRRVVGWGIEFVDIDNDGDEDVLVAYGADYDPDGSLGGADDFFQNTEEQYLTLYRNEGGYLELLNNDQWNLGTPSNFRGYAMVDWNNDGYLDIIARSISGPARYYQSNCGDNNSLMISLQQTGSNPSAIGARIWVTDQNDITRFRDITAGSTNISSSSPPIAHFGLSTETVVKITIRWPDGQYDQVANIPTKQWLHITRPPD